MTYINKKSLEQTLDIIRELYEKRKKPMDLTFDFQPFSSCNHHCLIAAVDGSHHSTVGSALTITSIRSGYQIHQNFTQIEEKIDDVQIEILLKNEESPSFFQHVYERYYQRVVSKEPKEIIAYDKTVERIRTLLEWEKIYALLEILPEDSIIIFDGSIISGAISTSHLFFYEKIIQKAKAHSIALVGLSKDTSLHLGGFPIVPFLLSHAESFYPNQSWYWKADGLSEELNQKEIQTYFARFSGMVPYIFRLDFVCKNVKDILEKIGAYCFLPETIGYPYPMQMIHDRVIISKDIMSRIYQLLKEKCVDAGLPSFYLDSLFQNYHKQLDIISKGR